MRLILELLPWALLPIVAAVCLFAGAGMRDHQLFSDPDRMKRARRRWDRQQRRNLVSREFESRNFNPADIHSRGASPSGNGNGNGHHEARPAQYLRRTW